MSTKAPNRGRRGLTGMRKRAGAGIAASSLLLIWFLASVLVHPLPHDISDRVSAPLLPGSDIAPSVANVFDHACFNCHSEKTRWPWYSHVAPVSWLVENDV